LPENTAGPKDLNGDGRIDVVDVTLVFQHTLDLIKLE